MKMCAVDWASSYSFVKAVCCFDLIIAGEDSRVKYANAKNKNYREMLPST
jgi:hypothetical protein